MWCGLRGSIRVFESVVWSLRVFKGVVWSLRGSLKGCGL